MLYMNQSEFSNKEEPKNDKRESSNEPYIDIMLSHEWASINRTSNINQRGYTVPRNYPFESSRIGPMINQKKKLFLAGILGAFLGLRASISFSQITRKKVLPDWRYSYFPE